MTIDINILTIAEAREIAALVNGLGGTAAPAAKSPLIGKHVVVRTFSAGVASGSRMSTAVDLIELTQAVEIIPTTEAARKVFDGIRE